MTDDDQGQWLGCVLLLVAVVVGFIAGVLVGRGV